MAIVKLIGITVGFLMLGILGLGIRVIFHRSHNFPETSAGHNPELRKRGISCPKSDEQTCWGGENSYTGCSDCLERSKH
ncbi:MAG TPA: hypothetical protein PKL74_01215 [Tenuifilaceae bacterium]|nr:hypothetical protein [Tenuifilaceae bacterium]